MVSERASVVLRKIDPQGLRHRRGERPSFPVHGSGAVHHDKSVLIPREIFQCIPGHVQTLPLFFRKSAPETGNDRRNDIIRGKRPCMHCRRVRYGSVKKCLIPPGVIPPEGRSVLKEGPGRLLLVLKSIVLLPEIVLQDPDPGPQCRQCSAVLCIRHSERPGSLLRQTDCLRAGSIDRREPLAEKRYSASGFHGFLILLQLLPDHIQHILLTRRPEQAQKVVISAEFAHKIKVLPAGLRLIVRKPSQYNTKHPSLAESAPDIPGEKQRLHGEICILGIGPQKDVGDIFIGCGAEGADAREQIKTF